ncbi:MAG TPA: AI-2E family transporter [Candidatus Desulfofervidus auxilii]|uniref:AI-2E family transporter n=1 Tax=Desulfofervidus auxilii TaxID=1621989 RepID=A0A7V0NEN2_DESA2|nr:AI-2E family transporter [Candidatus Desulfofervidus auxilii]
MDNTNQQKILEISWVTILRVVTALAVLYFLFLIKDLLVWFLFALIISVLFNPAINFLQRKHIPRTLAAMVVYLGIFSLLGIFLWRLAPILLSELKEFSMRLPEYFEDVSPYLKGLRIAAFESFQSFSQAIESLLFRSSANIFTALGTFFGSVFSAITIFAIAFFLSLEEKGVERTIYLLAPHDYKEKALAVWRNTQKKITWWFGVRVLGVLFVGLLTGITCFALNVKYAAFFGILAGISDFIVTFGPLFTGGIIAILIALSSLPKAFIFVIAFTFIQQIEGHVLLPVLTKKFLRLPPALVLMAILIGGKLWGVLGAILAIPLMGMLFEFIKGLLEKKDHHQASQISSETSS